MPRLHRSHDFPRRPSSRNDKALHPGWNSLLPHRAHHLHEAAHDGSLRRRLRRQPPPESAKPIDAHEPVEVGQVVQAGLQRAGDNSQTNRKRRDAHRRTAFASNTGPSITKPRRMVCLTTVCSWQLLVSTNKITRRQNHGETKHRAMTALAPIHGPHKRTRRS